MSLRLTEQEAAEMQMRQLRKIDGAPPRRRAPETQAKLEALARRGALESPVGILVAQILDEGIPEPIREHVFCPGRRFPFDLAWPGWAICLPNQVALLLGPHGGIAVEIDGSVHRTEKRWKSDQEKFNLAVLMGWQVLHWRNAEVRSGEAIAALCKIFLEGNSS